MREYFKDGKHYIDARPEGVELMCDFCGSYDPPFKDYHCKDVEVIQDWEANDNRPHISEGDWAACQECAKLIDQNKRNELVKRCVAISSKKLDIDPIESEILIRAIQRKFFESRI